MEPSVLAFVLDGLEQALELERELGVRAVEVDRSVLDSGREIRPPSRPSRPVASGRADLVFLHDRALSSGGVEMMAKIIAALGLSADKAPVVVAPPVPKAKVVVVLGGRAMKRHFPGMKGEPGQWIRRPDGTDVLITYSPEYILRFGAVTAAVQKLKQDMWRSLKAVKQRLAS